MYSPSRFRLVITTIPRLRKKYVAMKILPCQKVKISCLPVARMEFMFCASCSSHRSVPQITRMTQYPRLETRLILRWSSKFRAAPAKSLSEFFLDSLRSQRKLIDPQSCCIEEPIRQQRTHSDDRGFSTARGRDFKVFNDHGFYPGYP